MFKKIFSQSSAERMKMITEGDLLKTFMFLAVPGIMLMMVQSILPLIDGLIIYNYDDPVSGAAISYSSSIQSIFTMGANGLCSAGSAYIGQMNGTGDYKKARGIAGQLLSIAFVFGLLCIPILIGLGFILTAGMDADVKGKIILYNLITAVCLPLIVCQGAFSSIKNVFGHPEITFIRMLLFVPVKLLFSLLFIVVFQWGIIGAAMSAFCAYFFITLFIIYDLFIKQSDERFGLHDLKIRGAVLKKYLVISWPAIVQTSTKSLGFFIAKQDAARFGTVALTGQSLSGDINGLFMSFTACYDMAVVPFVSINVGAGNAERAKKSAYLALKIGIISSVVFMVISILLGPFIIRLFTNDPEIIAIAVRGNFIQSLGFVGFAVLFNEMPTFVGLGMNKASLFIQTMRIWVVRLASMYALYYFVDGIGIDAIFISLTVANIVGGAISHYIFRKASFAKRM